MSGLYGTTLSVESIKVIAESIGLNALPDDAAKELADDVSFKIKQIVQDSAKFMHHAKRQKLLISVWGSPSFHSPIQSHLLDYSQFCLFFYWNLM